MFSLKNSLKKAYNSGAFHVTAGTFLAKFVAFFGSIFVVRILSKEDYGLLSYVENIYSYALIFAGLGLSNALLRFLIIAVDAKKQRSFFDYIIKNSVFRNTFIFIILLVLSKVVVFPSNYGGVNTWLSIIALLIPFQDLLNDDLYTLRALFKTKLYAYASFVVALTLIAGRICGALLFGIAGVIWSRILINFIFGTIGYLLIKNKLMSKVDSGSLSRQEAKEINSYSFQYMITNGFWAIFLLNDAFLLGLLLNDPAGLADFKVACVLPSNISLFATAIGVFVAPYFTKQENDTAWVKRNYIKVFVINAVIVALATTGLILLSKPLVRLMYGDSYLNVVPLMRLMSIAAFVNSGLRYTTANLLSAMGEVRFNLIVSAVGVAIQIIADIVCIPIFGVFSIPFINCAIYLAMSICLFIVFKIKFLTVKTSYIGG